MDSASPQGDLFYYYAFTVGVEKAQRYWNCRESVVSTNRFNIIVIVACVSCRATMC